MAAVDLVSVILCLIISLCPQINAFEKPSDVCPQGSIYIDVSNDHECPQNIKYTFMNGESLCIRKYNGYIINKAWFTQTRPLPQDRYIKPKILYSDDDIVITVTFDRNVTDNFEDHWTYSFVSNLPCNFFPEYCTVSSQYRKRTDYFSLQCDMELRVLSPPLIEVSNTKLKPIASTRTEEELQQNLYLIYKYKYTPGTQNIKILFNNTGADKPKIEWVLEPPQTASTKNVVLMQYTSRLIFVVEWSSSALHKRESGTIEENWHNRVLILHERDNNTFLNSTFVGNGIKIHVNITFVVELVSGSGSHFGNVAIVFIVLGVLTAILVVAGGVCCWRCRSKQVVHRTQPPSVTPRPLSKELYYSIPREKLTHFGRLQVLKERLALNRSPTNDIELTETDPTTEHIYHVISE